MANKFNIGQLVEINDGSRRNGEVARVIEIHRVPCCELVTYGYACRLLSDRVVIGVMEAYLRRHVERY